MGCLSTQRPPGVGDACVLSWGPEEDAMVKCFVVARAREEGVRTPVSEMVVDIVRGVHALIPKTIFAPDLRREMTMV